MAATCYGLTDISMRPIVQEVEELQNKILQMGGLVENSIRNSIQSLVTQDEQMATDVLRSEDRINQLDIEIDEFATRLLALHQPVARDLRFATAAIKINSDLERMGDLASNIARHSISFMERSSARNLVDIPRMSKTVQAMVRDSLDALARHDEALARSVLVSDDIVDDLKDSVYQELLGMLEAGTAPPAPAFDLMFIAHNLERIADHATNIAEDVLFLTKGMDVRHNRAQ